ncbi:hypothetical protein [Cognatishimia sp. MH4019]|uniref:hypothetical protein n=1 Tax=Cognatishimia sp. MH4019 TaxID=2854030 RepID=UPI001CD276C5|nr:hypothetical protein [Cognatishimia sp. MH4019]
MNLRWFVRASKWARNPPSEKMVKLVFGIILAGLVLVGIEYFIGWPDWLTVNEPGRMLR